MRSMSAAMSAPNFKDKVSRAVLAGKSLVGTNNYRKFLIVGAARTGSTLLVDLLNSHSQAIAFGELFRSVDSIGWDIPPFATCQNEALITLYKSDPRAFLQKSVFRRWP